MLAWLHQVITAKGKFLDSDALLSIDTGTHMPGAVARSHARDLCAKLYATLSLQNPKPNPTRARTICRSRVVVH
jgi:hypothetical protein